MVSTVILTHAGLQQLSASDVLFEIAGTPVTIATLITAGGVLIGSLLLAKITGLVLNRFVARHADPIAQGSFRSTIRLGQYTIVALGLLLALDTIGVQLRALFAAGALFAVAIGFAMQNVVGNFISGIILLLERSIKPGDIVEVEGQIAQIRDMGVRSTIARTLDDEDIIIPSTYLVQNAVRNYTLRDSDYRLRATVGVTYDSDMKLVRDTLEATARDLPWRIRSRDPVVYMREFGSSSVDFEVSVWVDDPWSMNRRNSDLHEAIWWALRDAGVTIAFPQLDVHLDPPALDALAARGRRVPPAASPAPEGP